MYTQCPECLTVYEISEDALQAALGIVHCGHCAQRFDALRTLSDALPEGPRAALPEREPSDRAPTLTAAIPPATFASVALPARKPGTLDTPTQPIDNDASPAPSTADTATADTSADDWFASLESELVEPPHTEPDSIEPSNIEPAVDDDVARVWEQGNDTFAPQLLVDCTPTPAAEADNTFAETPAIDLPTDDPSQPLADAAMPWQLPLAAFSADTPEASNVELVGDAAEPDPVAATPAATEGDERTPATDPAAQSVPAQLDGAVDATAPLAPIYVRPHRRVPRTGIAWTLGCLLLASVLAAQLVWAERATLLRNPTTHPWIVRACRSIPCRLPLTKDGAKLALVARDVRPDPDAAGALTITATVRNDAAFAQPWPVMEVMFTDLSNNPVAMRRFRPAEYMPDRARRAAGIAPGATAAIAVEVADPGKRATGFRFSFE